MRGSYIPQRERERDYMAEFETPLQVGQGLLTTAYIYAIELVDRYRKKELGK